ncbi:Receptor-type guanylate cyclase gcy-28 [Eumeta japonica]|uniref:Receptor-type guanylate cyclase gcy-28 n=1 Tax=Eumeta variegata TaxID=151549 RepID=A0A4C1TWK2_EUMVA|nr:Receptor-type guanylate cyclase gcy-28 [Eumeta japonica]
MSAQAVLMRSSKPFMVHILVPGPPGHCRRRRTPLSGRTGAPVPGRGLRRRSGVPVDASSTAAGPRRGGAPVLAPEESGPLALRRPPRGCWRSVDGPGGGGALALRRRPRERWRIVGGPGGGGALALRRWPRGRPRFWCTLAFARGFASVCHTIDFYAVYQQRRRKGKIQPEHGTRIAVVVVCANPGTIRELMLAADELNMVSSGEYVFFNIELFSNLASTSSREPWKVEGDTEERNERAKRAYSAVLTVSCPAPENQEYLDFSDKVVIYYPMVKELAASKYNYTFAKGEAVSTFVAAFYDAVLLYALALNATLSDADPAKPLDGAAVLRQMWNRTFKGITPNAWNLAANSRN